MIPITTVNLGTKERYMFSFTSRPFYPQENSPWNSLRMRLGRSLFVTLDATVWFQRVNYVFAMQSSVLLITAARNKSWCSAFCCRCIELCLLSSTPQLQSTGVNHSSTLKMEVVRSTETLVPQITGRHMSENSRSLQFATQMSQDYTFGWVTQCARRGIQNSHPTCIVKYDAV